MKKGRQSTAQRVESFKRKRQLTVPELQLSLRVKKETDKLSEEEAFNELSKMFLVSPAGASKRPIK